MSIEKRIDKIEIDVTDLQKKFEHQELRNKINTHAGFIEIYNNNLSNHKNCKDCYEAVEDIYFDFYNDFKYSSYESFRVYLVNQRKKDKR